MKILIALIIAIAIVSGVWVLQRNSTPAETPAPTPIATPLLAVTSTATPSPQATSEASSPVMQSSVKEFTVTARQFSFDPAVIRVEKGDRVKLTLNNIDVVHGLAIPQYGVNLNAPVGQPQSAQFVADKTGVFDFFCSVFCGSGHREMKGQLIVD